jgi:diacylglycerol kinase (ATP)
VKAEHAHLIVNPAAGAGKTGRNWPRILDLVRATGMKFEHAVTEAPGHAVELAKFAVHRGYRRVISVGGDGTVNEIVNGLHQSGGLRDTALGIISTGTGSDYVRTLGLPRRYPDSICRLGEATTRTVDVGVVSWGEGAEARERLFANFAGMGFDAEIVRRTTQQFKHFGALPGYLAGLFATLVTYKNKHIGLRLDGEETERRVCTVIMNNGRYGGGGMKTAPGAEIDDGLLDVLVVGDLAKLDLLRSLPMIYKGTHLNHKKVMLYRAREIGIRSLDGTVPLQADGELLGTSPARFTVLSGALKVLV